MSSLSVKSDKEICQLLDEYGIKHGPIVESTRKLYEKKLNEAMAKKTKPSSPDKTYYREEQEEVEYVTYHQPQQQTRHEVYGDVTRRSKASDSDFAHDVGSKLSAYREDVDYTNEPVTRQSHSAYQSSSRPPSSKPVQSAESTKSAGVPAWLRILVFLIIAAFLYYVYTSMEPAEETPFKTIQ
ncbi:emerin (Emery-Dreifuss muscular dystrophy) isoform 1 [Danio rerio]|uniref:Emerin (Emery-Dreifuss muscular dystrophy) n=2 Tax=Danio rerio TaxID=7955 RepID=E9QIK0_DANRE|nr:emerin (Emery-Dreifuss muscular dystrophy) isoform 1 [Danio rerio]|eukprot:XP_001924046.1 emerin isoform X1 [Danio rerio]